MYMYIYIYIYIILCTIYIYTVYTYIYYIYNISTAWCVLHGYYTAWLKLACVSSSCKLDPCCTWLESVDLWMPPRSIPLDGYFMVIHMVVRILKRCSAPCGHMSGMRTSGIVAYISGI